MAPVLPECEGFLEVRPGWRVLEGGVRWRSSGYKDHLEGEAEILWIGAHTLYSTGTTILTGEGLTCEITTVPDVILVSPDERPEL